MIMGDKGPVISAPPPPPHIDNQLHQHHSPKRPFSLPGYVRLVMWGGAGYLDRRIGKPSLMRGHLSGELNVMRDAHLGDLLLGRGRKKCKCPGVEWLSVGGAGRSVQGAGPGGWDARQQWPLACMHRSNTDSQFLHV